MRYKTKSKQVRLSAPSWNVNNVNHELSCYLPYTQNTQHEINQHLDMLEGAKYDEIKIKLKESGAGLCKNVYLAVYISYRDK